MQSAARRLEYGCPVAFPVISADSIGWLTTEQMIEVDRVMIEDLHIELIQMMENAGRNLARLALDRYSPSRVTVCSGSGGNGGGGLVAAYCRARDAD